MGGRQKSTLFPPLGDVLISRARTLGVQCKNIFTPNVIALDPQCSYTGSENILGSSAITFLCTEMKYFDSQQIKTFCQCVRRKLWFGILSTPSNACVSDGNGYFRWVTHIHNCLSSILFSTVCLEPGCSESWIIDWLLTRRLLWMLGRRLIGSLDAWMPQTSLCLVQAMAWATAWSFVAWKRKVWENMWGVREIVRELCADAFVVKINNTIIASIFLHHTNFFSRATKQPSTNSWY